MKKYFLIIALLISLTSCATTVWQLKTDCNSNTEDLFKKITIILMQENFLIKVNDPKIGYLQAETVPSFSIWTGTNETRYWIFQVQDNKVTAQAKVVYIQQNIFGATTGGTETYYNDEAHSDWTWYWSVRNELEKICGNKIIFIEKKVH
jgi:hypothetical protein